MKKPDKLKYKEFPDEAPGTNVVRKKVTKPWDLEYMIINEDLMNSHSFFLNKAKLGVWNKDSWFTKILSVKHGLEQMNKLARTTMIAGKNNLPIYLHWRFAGKKFRLVHKETGEIVPLLSNDKEFYADTK